MKESVIPFLTILYNCNNYYAQLENKKLSVQIEDKWILSKLNSLIEKVTNDLEDYSLNGSFEAILEFVVKDFSRGYIKMTRDREDTKEIIGEVLEKVSLLLAPFAPYISEYIYGNFSKNSVHLSKWPKADKINKKLESDIEVVLKIIEAGLAERDKEQMGLKWPLAKAEIVSKKVSKDIEKIIAEQLNVKKIVFKEGKEISVKLDTKRTPELEAEGYAREISRKVQAFRKKLGLNKKDKVELQIIIDEKFKRILEQKEQFIKEKTNATEVFLVTTKKETFKKNTEFKIKDKKGVIGIRVK